jgi:hypothetical protein
LSEFFVNFLGQAPIKKRNYVSPFRSKHFLQILTLALMLLVMNKVFVFFLIFIIYVLRFRIYLV